jgi:hypothetical protein
LLSSFLLSDQFAKRTVMRGPVRDMDDIALYKAVKAVWKWISCRNGGVCATGDQLC